MNQSVTKASSAAHCLVFPQYFKWRNNTDKDSTMKYYCLKGRKDTVTKTTKGRHRDTPCWSRRSPRPPCRTEFPLLCSRRNTDGCRSSPSPRSPSPPCRPSSACQSWPGERSARENRERGGGGGESGSSEGSLECSELGPWLVSWAQWSPLAVALETSMLIPVYEICFHLLLDLMSELNRPLSWKQGSSWGTGTFLVWWFTGLTKVQSLRYGKKGDIGASEMSARWGEKWTRAGRV